MMRDYGWPVKQTTYTRDEAGHMIAVAFGNGCACYCEGSRDVYRYLMMPVRNGARFHRPRKGAERE